jgi:hypothetical protein
MRQPQAQSYTPATLQHAQPDAFPVSVAGVVFDAADEQSEHAGDCEHISVLAVGEPLVEQSGDPAEPVLAFKSQVVCGTVAVLRTKPVGGDADRVQGRVVNGGSATPLSPAAELPQADRRGALALIKPNCGWGGSPRSGSPSGW